VLAEMESYLSQSRYTMQQLISGSAARNGGRGNARSGRAANAVLNRQADSTVSWAAIGTLAGPTIGDRSEPQQTVFICRSDRQTASSQTEKARFSLVVLFWRGR